VVVCVKCGINLVTGKELAMALGQEQDEAPAGVGARVLGWLGDSLPGLFRPKIVVCAAVLAVVAAGLVALALVFVMLGGPISAFAVGALGLVAYAQALAWLINGEFALLSAAMTEFRGKDWSNFAFLTMLPIVVAFAGMRHSEKVEEELANTPSPVVQEPPPVPGEYDIVAAKPPSGPEGYTGGFSRSALAADAAGNLFFVDKGGYRVCKLDPATGALTVVAGTGEKLYTVDGQPAAKSALNWPVSVAVDGKGTVYFTDGRTVRKVDAKGIMTTVAGNGKDRNAGDGGPAIEAVLCSDPQIVVDPRDNLYILDMANGVIRRVDATTGIITAVAGNGTYGYSGDGGPAANASFRKPYCIAVDAKGNVYVADTFSHRIRKVDAATGMITTIAGTGERGCSGDGGPATQALIHEPRSVAVDAKGNVFFLGDNNRVCKVDAATGRLSIVAGTGKTGDTGDGGPATLATFNLPGSVVIDSKGTIYIGDDRNRRLRKLVYVGPRTEAAATQK
jgi:streptogramin lyase